MLTETLERDRMEKAQGGSYGGGVGVGVPDPGHGQTA